MSKEFQKNYHDFKLVRNEYRKKSVQEDNNMQSLVNFDQLNEEEDNLVNQIKMLGGNDGWLENREEFKKLDPISKQQIQGAFKKDSINISHPHNKS